MGSEDEGMDETETESKGNTLVTRVFSSSKNHSNQSEDEDEDDFDEEDWSCLHDSVALGNVERSLLKGNGHTEQQQRSEVERLPLLLRILSKSRPLASVSLPQFSKSKSKPSIIPKKNRFEEEGDTTESEEEADPEEDDEEEKDEILEKAVRRLEDRAAIYSVSESVEVVACHLAPHVARKISKLPPCHRRATDGKWDTAGLVEVGQNPANSRFQQQQNKRRKLSVGSKLGVESADDGMQSSDGGELDDYDMVDQPPELPSRKRLTSGGGERDSIFLTEGASEDSQEAFVTKALMELAVLVAGYLEQQNKLIEAAVDRNATGGGGEGQDNNNNEDSAAADSMVTLSMEESILAQARVVSETSIGGIIGTDLGATVASLFHHAIVLRHSHTAAALCHAGQPQAAHLIQRLAANCPAAIPGLVRGCTNVVIAAGTPSLLFRSEEGSSTTSADVGKRLKLAHASILALSQLSSRERQRIRTTLRLMGEESSALVAPTLLQLQLEMALDHGDPVDLACFLIQHLSASPLDSINSSHAITTTRATVATRTPGTQASAPETANDDDEDDDNPKAKPSLAQLIGHNAGTRIPQICECLINGMRTAGRVPLASPGGRLSGRLCLLLRAFLWVVLTQELEDLHTAESHLSDLLDESKQLLLFGMKNWTDELYCLLLSSMLLSAIGLISGPEDQKTVVGENHTKLINDALSGAPTLRAKAYAGCLSCTMLASTDKPVLRLWILKYLGLKVEDIPNFTRMFSGTEEKLRRWCDERIGGLRSVLNSALENETLVGDTSAFILALELSMTALSKERVDKALQAVLLGKQAQSSELLAKEESLDFIAKAVSYLDNCDGVKLPVVLPLHLEMQSRRFIKGASPSESAAYLLQFVYCFVFRDLYPDSPFAFNPRSMPLKEVWLICDSTSLDVEIAWVTRTFLIQHVEKCAPDVVDLARYQKRIRSSHHFLLANKQELLERDDIKKGLRECIAKKEIDPSGEIAEQLFLRALLSFTEDELVTTTVSAFFSRPNSPPVCFSLSKLYGDPLVLMKCSIDNYWGRPGVRRVALFVLSLMLNANSSMITEACNDDTTSQELIAARDMLVVRCLILSAIKTGSYGVDSFSTVGLVRWIICSSSGLAAALLRQGLPPEELDWMTDFVPEIMSNAVDLATLFSDRVSLTPPERLAVADGVVRTVVMYGQRDDSQSEVLVTHAMAQLVNAFYLLVGVAGVSVSSIISESDFTMDATQLSRIGVLRIVKHVSVVRGYRKRIRTECIIALQKLYRMCKGEELVGGLAMAIGARQKGTLKEIQDAVLKAISAMGAGL